MIDTKGGIYWKTTCKSKGAFSINQKNNNLDIHWMILIISASLTISPFCDVRNMSLPSPFPAFSEIRRRQRNFGSTALRRYSEMIGWLAARGNHCTKTRLTHGGCLKPKFLSGQQTVAVKWTTTKRDGEGGACLTGLIGKLFHGDAFLSTDDI